VPRSPLPRATSDAMSYIYSMFSRVRTMSADQIRVRAQQAILQRRDALYHALGRPPASPGIRLRETRAGRFFFEADAIPAIIQAFREALPNEAESLVDRADRICRHEFDLLGYSAVSYGPEIDWSRDAVHGRRASLIPWHRINLFDFSQIGDPKVICELNRHQHFVVLAKAWWLTADERFVIELLRQWQSWLAQNPYPLGINWASSLEVAFRSMSWLWARALLYQHPLLSADFQRQVTEALALHGAHIRRYLSTYSSPNTHLLGEAASLLFIGLLCPEITAASHWRDLGWRIVQEELEHQVLPDGMHFEQSTYYHVYALDFFLHCRILAMRNGMQVPVEYDAKVQKMLELLASLCASGNPPRFGDDDGGRVFDGQRNRAEHFSDPLATGVLLYGRADWKRVCERVREETLWLLGPEAVRRFDQLPAESRIPINVFPNSGIYRFADRSSEVIMDAGPYGTGRGGHGHADALSLVWKVDGNEILCDPGTYTYPASNGRTLLRSTAAHNTLEVDDLSQADEAGPFAWKTLPQSTVATIVTGEDFEFLRGSHNGYARLSEPVVHTRWLFHAPGEFWIVRDVAEGGGSHKLRVSWHVGAGVGARLDHGGHVMLDGEGITPACLYISGGRPWCATVDDGFVSSAYGLRQMTPVIRASYTGPLPAELATVLIPRMLATGEAGLYYDESVSISGSLSVYCVNHEGVVEQLVFNDSSRPWTLKEWHSDAEFLRLQLKGEEVLRVSAIGVSKLSRDGRQIVNEPQRLTWLHWTKGRPPRLSPVPSISETGMAEAFAGVLEKGSSIVGKVNA
jgi:Heparinase II/III-like protein/Heparinase II/III N-terminus